ncbi:MAG: methyltransferase domain-containing protein [Rhizobiaceae bacterium]
MNMIPKIDLDQPRSEYVLDAPYTWSYFEYQNPLLMSFIARLNGFRMPSLNEPFTYCDLGCGNGVSVNLLASSFPQGQFYGVDFNSEHIENAQRIADKAGLTNVTFIDASFEQYEQSAPPQFDYIAMHGIYSWVGEEIREQIRRLVDLTLKPGGLVYLCYNTLPGWSELIPLWKMIQGYTAHLPVDSLTKARIGLENMAFLRDQGTRYFTETPAASRYLDRLLERDIHYVAHEFCNGCFEPQYFMDVANGFKEFGLDYAGTMKIHRNDMHNIISSRYHAHLEAAPNALERESRASFIRNEFFRRDLYIRDGERLEGAEAATLIENTIVGANTTQADLDRKLDLGRKSVDLETSFNPDLLKLAASGSYTIAELMNHSILEGVDPAEIKNRVIDLLGGYQIQPLAKKVSTLAPNISGTFELCSSVNRVLMEERLIAEEKTYVESAVMGSAIRLNFVNGLLVLALHGRTIEQAIAHVVEQISRLKDEKQAHLATTENLADWVRKKTRKFVDHKLPVLLKYEILKSI